MSTGANYGAWVLGILAICFIGSTAPACTSCEEIAWAGLVVRAVDSKTGEPICSAQVTAADGTYSEALLDQSGSHTDCSYAGATERPGTYRIVVSKSGYVTQTIDDIVVSTEPQCGHVEGQVIDVVLAAE